MPYRILSIDEILAQLAAIPPRISAHTTGLTPEQLLEHPRDGEWSINEILAHLRGCADIWGDRRIVAMIREDQPTIRTTDSLAWAKGEGYRESTFSENIQAFASQRLELLKVLHRLSAVEWQRSATTSGSGPKKQITIQSQGNGFARHERAHAQQIRKLAIQLRNQ